MCVGVGIRFEDNEGSRCVFDQTRFFLADNLRLLFFSGRVSRVGSPQPQPA